MEMFEFIKKIIKIRLKFNSKKADVLVYDIYSLLMQKSYLKIIKYLLWLLDWRK